MLTNISSPESVAFIGDWAGIIITMSGAAYTLRSNRLLGSNDVEIAMRAKKSANTGGVLALLGGIYWMVKTLITYF